MSQPVRIGNTPIFDQLVRDFALRGIFYDRLIADVPLELGPAYTGRSTSVQGARPAGYVVDEVQTDDAVDAAPKMAGVTANLYLEDETNEEELMAPNFWKIRDEE